jgi:hypothetical protein
MKTRPCVAGAGWTGSAVASAVLGSQAAGNFSITAALAKHGALVA